MKEILLYLLLSVSLSAGRNITTKKTASDINKKAQFFISQSVLFASAALLLLIFGIKDLVEVSSLTVVYGIVYGVLLISSQWMFTLSLKMGNTSVCSVVYSLGFILPTVSGTLFWEETFTFLNFIGVFIAVVIVLLTAKKNDGERKHKNKVFLLYILIAMVSSGGLGIMQKVQQSSKTADEKGAFLLIAFTFAFCGSFLAFLISHEKAFSIKKTLYPALTGFCFGGANLCNTVLAGKMESAVFFPLQNISTILLTALLGITVFKEKLTLKTAEILLLGIAVIILFSV